MRTRLAKDERIHLLDVRRRGEQTVLKGLPQSLTVPYGKLPSRLHELPQDGTPIPYCQFGLVGLAATAFLLESGFRRVANLQGGLEAWQKTVG